MKLVKLETLHSLLLELNVAGRIYNGDYYVLRIKLKSKYENLGVAKVRKETKILEEVRQKIHIITFLL